MNSLAAMEQFLPLGSHFLNSRIFTNGEFFTKQEAQHYQKVS